MFGHRVDGVMANCILQSIRALAIKNGYVISFADVSEEELVKASRDPFLYKYEAMSGSVLFYKGFLLEMENRAILLCMGRR